MTLNQPSNTITKPLIKGKSQNEIMKKNFDNQYILICQKEKNSSFKYSELIIPSIPICVFILTQIISVWIRRKDWKKQFYHKSIFEPSITGVNIFFSEVQLIVKDIKEKNLDDIKSKEKRRLINIYAESSRKFENDILLLLGYNYKKQYHFVNEEIILLRDKFVNTISELSSSKLSEFEQILITSKSRLVYSYHQAMK